MPKIRRPILIGAIRLNSREEIRAELSTFRGRNIIDLRRWFRNAKGKMKPTRKGIAVAIGHLPALTALVRKAIKRAKREGLL